VQRSIEQRQPRLERCRPHRIIKQGANEVLGILTLDHEDDLASAIRSTARSYSSP
jgi:hypothetical protein